VEVPNDETQKRLAKVRAHADFAAALAWRPVDPLFERQARRHAAIGWTALAAGTCLALGLWLARPESVTQDPRPPYEVAGAAVALAGAVFLGLAGRARAEHRRTPMLKRAAYVLDRRSLTNEQGGVGSTTYFFRIRFEDGSEGEFSHVGRGSMYEPPANGAAGVAYTRGARMIEFRRI
jgi:hypothetical protein